MAQEECPESLGDTLQHEKFSEKKGTWTGLCRRQEFDKQMEGKGFPQRENCIYSKNTEKQE